MILSNGPNLTIGISYCMLMCLERNRDILWTLLVIKNVLDILVIQAIHDCQERFGMMNAR